jgi:hypothetical protein
MTVPLQLTFWHQFGNEIGVESGVSVDRSTTPRPRFVRSRSSLCDSGRIPETREPFSRKTRAYRRTAGHPIAIPGGQGGT